MAANGVKLFCYCGNKDSPSPKLYCTNDHATAEGDTCTYAYLHLDCVLQKYQQILRMEEAAKTRFGTAAQLSKMFLPPVSGVDWFCGPCIRNSVGHYMCTLVQKRLAPFFPGGNGDWYCPMHDVWHCSEAMSRFVLMARREQMRAYVATHPERVGYETLPNKTVATAYCCEKHCNPVLSVNYKGDEDIPGFWDPQARDGPMKIWTNPHGPEETQRRHEERTQYAMANIFKSAGNATTTGSTSSGTTGLAASGATHGQRIRESHNRLIAAINAPGPAALTGPMAHPANAVVSHASKLPDPAAKNVLTSNSAGDETCLPSITVDAPSGAAVPTSEFVTHGTYKGGLNTITDAPNDPGSNTDHEMSAPGLALQATAGHYPQGSPFSADNGITTGGPSAPNNGRFAGVRATAERLDTAAHSIPEGLATSTSTNLLGSRRIASAQTSPFESSPGLSPRTINEPKRRKVSREKEKKVKKEEKKRAKEEKRKLADDGNKKEDGDVEMKDADAPPNAPAPWNIE